MSSLDPTAPLGARLKSRRCKPHPISISWIATLFAALLWLGLLPSPGHGANLTPLVSYQFHFSATELLFDDARGCAYLLDNSGRRAVKVSLTNGTVLAEISFTNRPIYGAISPNRQRLYLSQWTTEPGGNPGAIAEIELNTFTVSSSFPIAIAPTFLVATDNRLVVASGSGDGVTAVKCYSAVTGAQVDTIGAGFAYYGTRLLLHPSQSALYALSVNSWSETYCLDLRRFNAATGDISYPSSFFDGTDHYCLPDAAALHSLWMLPGGSRLLLNTGDILGIGSNPLELNLQRRLEVAPVDQAFADPIHQALFTVSSGAPHRLHHFNLATLEYGATYEWTNTGTYYWTAALRDVLWLGRQEGGETFLDAFVNPALGSATNRPPQPAVSVLSSTLTTTNVIVFDAAGSRDDNSTAGQLMFRWDWESDGTFDRAWQTSSTSTHLYNAPGTKRVTVEVRDRFAATTVFTTNAVVQFVPDEGQLPGFEHPPFVLPFVVSRATFHPHRSLMYLLETSSNRLVAVNLTNGLIERMYEFAFPPHALALTPDGERLFVGLSGARATDGYLAEFQTSPLIKVNEWNCGMTPELLAATDAGLVVAAGLTSGQGNVQAFVAATQVRGNSIPLNYGFGGLAVSRDSQEVYASDEVPWARVSWSAPLNSVGQLGTPMDFPEEFGTGEFLVLPRNGSMVRSSGAVFTAQREIVTNLNYEAEVFAADSSRDAFVTVDGSAQLHAYRQSDGVEFGGYPLKWQPSILGTQGGWVYALAVIGNQTFIERRRLPAANPSDNLPPEVSITIAGDRFVVQDGETVTVNVTAADLDGTVTSLILVVDDTIFPATDSEPLYWSATPFGKHLLYAVAVDNLGAASTSAVVEVTVNVPPTVRFVSPDPNAQLTVPATVVLAVDASDSDGWIERVDFYRDFSYLTTVTNPPFALTFIESNRVAYTYAAVATDNTGAQAGTEDLIVTVLGLKGDDILDPYELGSTAGFATNLSNLTATREKLEPLHAGRGGNHSLWWRWTAPADGSLVVSTRGSGFDTLLSAYLGEVYPWATYNELTAVAANDDDSGNAPASRIKFAVQNGTVYHLAVDGYGEGAGQVSFNLDFVPSSQFVTNDFLTTAIVWTGETNFSIANNNGATRDADEPIHAGNIGGRSLWWAWSHDSPRYLTLSTEGSDLDTLLAVYIHNGIGPLTGANLIPVGSNDDQPQEGRTSWLRIPSGDRQTYYIAVDGYNGSGGDVKLSLRWEPLVVPPPNDDFRNAAALSGLISTATANTSGATKEPEEMALAGNPGGRSVWWRWTATGNGKASISTKGSTFDTLLGVFTGGDLANLIRIADNDDSLLHPPTSMVEWNALGGTSYWISVDGYNGAGGHLSVTLQSTATPSPKLRAVQMVGDLFQFEVLADSVQWLIVERSINLHDWVSISTNRVSSGSNPISVPTTGAGSPHFFRALVIP